MPHLVQVKRSKFEKFLKYVGCHLKRIEGDHFVYDRAGLERPVIITADREVPVFIIRNNLRTLKMNPDEFLEILKDL